MSEEAASSKPLPVIGILCIDVATSISKCQAICDNEKIKSYIAASYVKYLESAGARVMPIWIGRDRSYYENIMQKINGILIPGGAVFFSKEEAESDLPNDCVLSSEYIFDIAKSINEYPGQYFPIWGTCLGFQLIILHSRNDDVYGDPRRGCVAVDNHLLPLDFEADANKSKLFANLEPYMKKIMAINSFGYHKHKYCITKDDLIDWNIAEQWRVLATNKDKNDLEFITFVEHQKYPFYGCQIHPERIQHENIVLHDDPETCIAAAQYFANFFVAECRKNNNCFASETEARRHLIHQFPITNTGTYLEIYFLQCYLFKITTDYPNSSELKSGHKTQK